MNLKTIGVLLPVLLPLGFAACAQVPAKVGDEASQATAPSEARQPVLPEQDLTQLMLFDFLLGETALQRGSSEIAVSTYLGLAKSTRDPRVAQRATEVALQSRRPVAALEAATIWVELDPDSIPARQTVTALLVNASKLDLAQPHLEKLLASEGANIGRAFMQLNNLLARNTNKAETLALVQRLALPYPNLAEAHFAVAQAAWLANRFEVALAAMKQVVALRPEWELAVIYQGQILQRSSTASAIEFFESYLGAHPAAKDVRLSYARMLVTDKKISQARVQFQQLLTEHPANADIALAVGLLSMELRDFDAAEANFKKVLELGYKDPGTARFYLARVYEETKRIDTAMEWYRSVEGGDQYLPAQAKYAGLLAKQGKMGEARKHLQQLPAENNQQRAQLILAEAQLLRDTGAYQEVFNLLSSSLEKLPNYPDLLYDRALVAERLGKVDVMEQDLRKLIQLKPDYAHAYNALGYSFADRSYRLPEALELIEKAVKLAPDDPHIIDSLGWVHYRIGNLKEGIKYLNQAFAIRPDPEIAAHLGEVLWKQGEKEAAKKIWQTALKSDPDNEVLLKTIKKFMP